MAAPKRKPFQRQRDLVRTTELYLQEWTQAEIAKELGLSVAQINYDLQAIRREWAEKRSDDLEAEKDKVLAKVYYVYRECDRAWRRSIGKKEDTLQEVSGEVPGGTDQPTARKGKRQVRTTERAGDPRHIMGMEWAIEQECKLKNLEPPKRKELTGANGGPMEITDPVELAKYRRETAGLLRLMEQEEATNGKPPIATIRQRPGKLMILGNPQRKVKGNAFGGNGQEKA